MATVSNSLEKDERTYCKCGKCDTCGFRHVVVFLAFLGFIYFNAIRATLSVALIAMVNSTHSMPGEQDHNDSSCDDLPHLMLQNQSDTSTESSVTDHSNIDSKLGEQFEWDLKTQSFQLSALFYGSLVSQVLGGIVTQRFGIRWVFGITGLLSSVLTMMTPVSAHWNAMAVVAIRIIQGITQSPIFSIRNQAASYWVPVKERSRAFSFITIGTQVGFIMGMFVSGILAESVTLGGWPSIFYVFGAFGITWSVVWITLVTDSPQQHRWVSRQELQKIEEGGQNKVLKGTKVPWGDIMKSLPFWIFCIANIGHGAVVSILTTQIPMYLNKALKFNITSSGTLTATTILLQAVVSFAGGYLSDILRRSGRLSVTTIRKVMTALGFIGSGLCLMGIGQAGCHLNLVVGLLYAAFGLAGILFPGFLIVVVDMTPSFSAILNGIPYTIGFFCSALTPYIVTVLVGSEESMEGWSKVFMVFAAILILCGLQFVLFGSAERQPWDSPKPADSDFHINSGECAEKQYENTKF